MVDDVSCLEEFYLKSPSERDRTLLHRIQQEHRRHFPHNRTYRATMELRGLGPSIENKQIPGLLRVSAITFKSYGERLGTSFPQDDARGFLRWLQDHVSIDLMPERFVRFNRRYKTLESLLCAVEKVYQDLGLEILTSSGTSGKATILIRDAQAMQAATQAYFTAIDHAWDIGPDHNLIFVMPFQTRVAMARLARMGTRELDWGRDNQIVYTMPFTATPDIIRIRTGRNFREGLRGLWERRFLNPFITWANSAMAEGRYVKATLQSLRRLSKTEKPVMLLGGLVQLDAVARWILHDKSMELPPGSRIATGGGMKELYPRTPAQIRCDLGRTFICRDGSHLPITDIYGMAESHWAAFQCLAGNYHIPPWVYVGVLDDRDRIVESSDASGLLAFWDPIAGGRLYPPFYQTADRVRLINGNGHYEEDMICECGQTTAYLARDSIQRIDLLEEAGCGATI